MKKIARKTGRTVLRYGKTWDVVEFEPSLIVEPDQKDIDKAKKKYKKLLGK